MHETYWQPDQLESLVTATERVLAGAATVLLVEGDAGTGKTTLLDEFQERLPGFRKAEAIGVETGLPPYGVADQWGGGGSHFGRHRDDAAVRRRAVPSGAHRRAQRR